MTQEKKTDIDWVTYSVNLWGEGWVVAKNTPANRERYSGKLITRKEYEEAKAQWRKENPNSPDYWNRD